MDPRRVEGRLVEEGEPAYYVRDLSWWRRALLWTIRTHVFEVVLAVPVLAGGWWAFTRWGWYFVLWFFSTVFAFAFGWNAARRKWEREGYLDKL